MRRVNVNFLTAVWAMSCFVLPAAGVALCFFADEVCSWILGLLLLSVPVMLFIASAFCGYVGRMVWDGTWRFAIIPAVFAALASENFWGTELARIACICIAISYASARLLSRAFAVMKSDLQPMNVNEKEENYETV